MNKNLIHLKNDLFSLKKSYIICLFLVLLFGVYKNIICLLGGEFNQTLIISRLILIFIALLIGGIKDYLEEKKINVGFNTIISLIVAMILPFNINPLIFIVSLSLLFLLDYIDKDNKLNRICIIKLIAILILFLFSKYSYLTPAENMNEYAYSLFDVFLGNQVGGIFSTSVLLSLISLVILGFNKIYKINIVLISIGAYIATSLIFLTTGNYMSVFNHLLNSSNIFAFVVIAPFSMYSPYKPNDVLIYSLCLGMLTSLISYFLLPYEGAIIAILLSNILMVLKDKFHKSTNYA